MRTSFISTFLLAAIASVSALSLSDIDALPDNMVTPGCQSTYSQEISECPSASDFQAKKACSDDCIDALNTHQQDVILSCRQAFVSPSSLLRKLLDGGLVTTLCPAASAKPSSAPVTSPTSTKAASSAASSTVKASSTAKASVYPTASNSALSGFLTMTIAPPTTSPTDIPSELTLDDSAEPTVSEISALAQYPEPSSSATEDAPTAVNTPLESTGGAEADKPTSGAGTVRAVLASVALGFSVILGTTLL
ncbi:hypothetical protein Q9L58_003671 [Maublancomyces gigas]|uniref:Uncharacterized protein n=1 Tax=Discina gigas TaxID=1032678 RepID=A0ABR3GN83_9PEZI